MNNQNFHKCPLCGVDALEYVPKADSYYCNNCQVWLEWDYVYNSYDRDTRLYDTLNESI